MRFNRLLITLPYFSGSCMPCKPAPTLKGSQKGIFTADAIRQAFTAISKGPPCMLLSSVLSDCPPGGEASETR